MPGNRKSAPLVAGKRRLVYQRCGSVYAEAWLSEKMPPVSATDAHSTVETGDGLLQTANFDPEISESIKSLAAKKRCGDILAITHISVSNMPHAKYRPRRTATSLAYARAQR